MPDVMFRHKRRVLWTTAILFLVALVVGGPITSKLKTSLSDFQNPGAQSLRAEAEVSHATGQRPGYGVVALVRGAGNVRDSAATMRTVSRVARLLSAQPGFQSVLDYPSSHSDALVSRDGHETVLLARFASQEDSGHAVERVRPQLTAADVRFGGADVTFVETEKLVASDLRLAEMLAFPILLALSFWVFRGLVAALLPLLVGGVAIVLAFLGLRIVDEFTGLSIFAVNLVTGLGLGLGIDYSLFVLSRYREERARDADTKAAMARTLATAGRTVLFSSLTVAAALASLLVFPLRFLYSMGIGGVLVALLAGTVSLIVLPAVLLALGPRIDALAPARLQRSRERLALPGAEGFWLRLAKAVTRRPGAVAVGTALVLLALASPALRLQLVPADAHVLPSSSQPRQVAAAMADDFALDTPETISMVVSASRADARQVSRLAASAAALAGRHATELPPRFLGRGTWEIELVPYGSAASATNQRLVRALRALPGALPVNVSGPTAQFLDQKDAIAARAPIAFAILALMTLGILFAMTGSAVIPFIALAMNVLTVGVAAGLLVLVFQDGHLSSLLGFSPIGGLEESDLVLLFTVAFALSTDYGVFLLARIKEAHDGGLVSAEAVALGLERTGRIVTAAALLFCVAIGAFATSSIFFIKELGVGAALAVAVDATLVRALLVPALLGCLGERAWWAPRPLQRLHRRIALGEPALAEAL